MIEAHIAKSLTDAGIGKRYHALSLKDFGPEGHFLLGWLQKGGGDAVKNDGMSVTLTGFGREPVIGLARAFHLAGAGVRVLTVSQLYGAKRAGGERWEDVQDCAVLFVSPAQTSMPRPLTPWQQDEIETFLSSRIENGRAVAMHLQNQTPPEPWWSSEFLQLVATHGIALNDSFEEKRK